MAAQRSARADLHLGVSLALIAGALNAGGFIAIGQYTSHMTGMLSSAADNLALGRVAPALLALGSVAAFLAGAASTAVMINYAKRSEARHVYAAPLLLEAALLLGFGVAGARLDGASPASMVATITLLCYVMGLQNALITKISNAEIRTTHVTGLVTDIGIELGKLVYWNGHPDAAGAPAVRANRRRLRVHLCIVAGFFVGGLGGALGFQHVGFAATIPLAVGLVVLAAAPWMRRA
ncbi:MAG: YoaK family protein [Pseudomonadota bacterium]